MVGELMEAVCQTGPGAASAGAVVVISRPRGLVFLSVLAGFFCRVRARRRANEVSPRGRGTEQGEEHADDQRL